MSNPPAGFASFEQKWLAAYPEQAAVAVFLDPDERLRASAFGCLVYEIEQSTFGMRDAQAAAAKLAWWRQELIGASVGSPQHPISVVLFADPRAQSLDTGSWPALADGALEILEPRGASNLSELLGGNGALYTSVARIESALFDGNPAEQDAIATLWTISHLLNALPKFAGIGDAFPFPLDLRARHGLTRSLLTQPGEQRTAALRDYLDMLGERAGKALAQAPDATPARRVRARLDLIAIRRARRALDPLAWFAMHPRAGRWLGLWLAWNEARKRVRRH